MIGDRCSMWYPTLVVGIILAVGGAASAQPSHPPVSTSRSTLAPATAADKPGTTTLYVGLFNGQTVNIYDAFGSGQPSAQLFDGLGNTTGGLAVDRARRLYVSTSSGLVMVYPNKGFVPVERYRFPDQYFPGFPLGIAVDGEGTLYAPLNIAGCWPFIRRATRRQRR